jgi:hypothetical protein
MPLKPPAAACQMLGFFSKKNLIWALGAFNTASSGVQKLFSIHKEKHEYN